MSLRLALHGIEALNTAIHELGHFIANLDHVHDRLNFMATGSIPKAQRTIKSQREDYAGKKLFTNDQRQLLIEQLKEGKWLGDFTVKGAGFQ